MPKTKPEQVHHVCVRVCVCAFSYMHCWASGAVLAHIYGDYIGRCLPLGCAAAPAAAGGQRSQIVLLLELALIAQAMRFAFVVMINNFQSKIGVALDKGGAYVGQLGAPFAAVLAEHRIGQLIVFKPIELI